MTLRHLAQRVDHRVEAQAAGGVVIVGIAVDLEAGALEHHAMVVPARIADPHLRLGKIALQEVGADAQRARAAQRLDRGHTVLGQRGAVHAEYQLLHGLAKAGDAGHRQIRARPLVGDQRGFGLAHRGHQRQAACVVEADADRQVDLVLTRVLREVFVQGQDGVAGVGVDMSKHENLRPDLRPIQIQ